MSKSNREYLEVLARVVEKVQTEYSLDGVPELTPAQIHRWFQRVKLEDIEHVVCGAHYEIA